MDDQDLARFDFEFPIPPPPREDECVDEGQRIQPPPRPFNVSCYGASSSQLLALTRTSHPSFSSRCFTGLQTYSGAEVLSILLLRHPELVQQPAVMEVGCGIGLTGAVAARCMRKGEQLVLTDGEEDAVRLTRLNLSLNLSTTQQREGEGEKEQLRYLLSSSRIQSPTVPPCGINEIDASDDPSDLPLISVVRAEWSEAGAASLSSFLSPHVHFSLIYGTDLFYSRTSVSSLLSFVLPFLGPSGHLLLCHTPRLAHLHSDLRNTAGQCGLRLAYLPLTAFLRVEEIRTRGWSQVDVAVLAREAEWSAVHKLYDGWAKLSDESDVERETRESEAQQANESALFDHFTVQAEDL